MYPWLDNIRISDQRLCLEEESALNGRLAATQDSEEVQKLKAELIKVKKQREHLRKSLHHALAASSGKRNYQERKMVRHYWLELLPETKFELENFTAFADPSSKFMSSVQLSRNDESCVHDVATTDAMMRTRKFIRERF